MSKEYISTRKHFYSKYHRMYSSSGSNELLETCQFNVFTNLLDEAEIVKSPPIVLKESGTYKRSNFSLLGYCEYNDVIREDDGEGEDDENEESILIDNWNYIIFNGFFSDKAPDEISEVRKDELEKSVKESIAFIDKTINKELINDVTGAVDLQNSIIKAHEENTLSKIEIYIITDKVIIQKNKIDSFDLGDIKININYWDLQRWNDLKKNKSRREPINIDLSLDEYKFYNINYVNKSVSKSIINYLAIFPANMIADLYDKYDTRLLEKNVRVFLSAGRKANLAMRKTIKNAPQNFFSFNNGLSATVQKIIFDKDKKISRLTDFQIVNGGQTTATLHYARERDRYDDGTRVSLEDVYVPVKITEITKSKEVDPSKIVSNISQAANTQSAIKNSDFHANNPFLIDIERHSKRLPVNDNSGLNTYYFFERMTGQYNASKNSLGTQKKYINIWLNERPRKLMFSKTDVSRWYNCMYGLPYTASIGNEKQFELFINDKNFKKPVMTENNFKTLVGFGVVFRRIRKLIGTAKGREYPPLISDEGFTSVGLSTGVYSSTMFHKLTKGRVDYFKIYNHEFNIVESLIERERINCSLDNVLEKIIKESWKHLKAFGGTAVQENTKKESCWNYFEKNFSLDINIEKDLEDFLISKEEKERRESVEIKNDFQEYFNGLNELTNKNPQTLQDLLDISSRETDYREHKSKIKNLINKIEGKENILTKKRVQDIIDFRNTLNSSDLLSNKKKSRNNTIIPVDLAEIYELVFKDLDTFSDKIEDYIISDDEKNFNVSIEALDKIKDLHEKLDIEEGLSINDLVELNESIDFFKEKKFII